ncbi:MAG: hypothetical protein AAF842_09170 [Planctomycetota bacterium]
MATGARGWLAAVGLTLVVGGVGGAVTPSAHGQSSGASAGSLYQVQRPQRRVAYFDFEERRLGNYESLPINWHAIGRRALIVDPNFHRQPVHAEMADRAGFPEFNDVRFDTTHAVSGEHSLMLGIDGGQAGAFLQNGAIVVVPGADYLITAKVRTEGLERAYARLCAYFIDALGRRLPGSVHAASIRDADADDDGWTLVSVRLTADDAAAARLGLAVELLQPGSSADSALGAREVVLSEVKGRAWFDDIAVWQLPFVEVATQSASGVYRGAQRPEVWAEVRDLTGRRLEARLRLYDHRLRPVAEDRRAVGAGKPTRWAWTPELADYGWYLIDLEVFELEGPSAGRVARSIGGLLTLPEDRAIPEAERHRWGLVAEGEPLDRLPIVAEIVEQTGLGEATLSVWSTQTTKANDEERQEALDEVVQRLVAAGSAVTMSMHPLPEVLAEEAGDASDGLALISADPAVWRPLVIPALTRHGPWVRAWQVGDWQAGDVFFYPDLVQRLAPLASLLQTRVADPQLVLPWRIDQPPLSGLSEAYQYAVAVPSSVVPDAIGGYLDSWPDRGRAWLRLETTSASRLPHERRIADLALRLIESTSAEPGRIEIASPWTRSTEREVSLIPDPLLGVFAQTAARLSGRPAAGELDLGPHLRARLFDGRDGALLAMWDRSAGGDPEVAMYLGERPVAIDVFGNRTPVPVVDGKHVVTLGPTPIFVEGIDGDLARLRASLAIDEPFVESEQVPHDRVVSFVNPWRRTISGQVVFTEPADWRIQPKRQFFSVAGGGTVELPIRVTFPASELAGPKRLTARLMIEAGQTYDVDLAIPMEVGLSDVQFDATVALEPGTAGTVDVVATCVVTNTGDRAWSMYSYATLPGHARQSLPISQLEPGQTIVRRFRFTDGGRSLAESPLRCGLRAINGPSMLNRRFTLDDVQ